MSQHPNWHPRTARAWLLVLGLALTVSVAVVLAQPLDPRFRAVARLRVSTAFTADAGSVKPDFELSTRFARTLKHAVQSQTFRGRVARSLGSTHLPMLDAEVSARSDVLELSAEDRRADDAAQQANAAASLLVLRAREIVAHDLRALSEPLLRKRATMQLGLKQARLRAAALAPFRYSKPVALRLALGAVANRESAYRISNEQYLAASSPLLRPRVTLFERADQPSGATLRSRALAPLVGGILSIPLGLGLLGALSRRRRSRTRESHVLPATAGRMLGTIPLATTHAELVPRTRSTAVALAFERLSSAIRLAEDARPSVILVTSPGAGEGKSTVVVNLAETIGAQGEPTCVVDLHSRRPTVHDAFSVSNRHGVADVLSGSRSLEEVLQPTESSGVVVLSSGQHSKDQDHPLTPEGLEALLRELRTRFSRILVDTPSVLENALATLVARHADAIVLVVRREQTRPQSIMAAIERLDATDLIQGYVSNGARG